MKKCFFKFLLVTMGFFFIMAYVSEAQAQKPKKKKEDNEFKEGNETNAKSSTDAEYEFVEGMKFFIREEYVKALPKFKKALALSGGNAAISYKIGETYYRMNNLKEAENYARKALEGDKSNKYYYVLLSKVYEEQGELEKAAKIIQDLISSPAGSIEYNYELADIYLKQDEYNKAIECYNQVEKTYGINESVVVQKQKIYIRINQFDKAIAEGHKLVQAFPGEHYYVISLAELMMANNQSDKALPILQEAAKDQSFDPRIYLLLAQIYRNQGKNKEAVSQLKIAFANPELPAEDKTNLIVNFMEGSEASSADNDFADLAATIVKVHPGNAKAHVLYGDILLLKQDKKEALNQYLLAVQSDNSEARIWQQILGIEADLNSIDSLIKHSNAALEVFPNQALFWLYNGKAHLRKRKYDEAVQAFEEGKRLAFSNQDMLNDFYIGLGDSYHGLKQYNESDSAYEKALKNAPNNAQALNNYSYYLALRKEKLELAKQMATRLIENNSNVSNYLDTYGWVLYVSKDYKKASKYLEQAAENSNSGSIKEHFGDVLFKLGEVEKALEQWQKAKKIGGTSDLIDKKIQNKSLYE